ncbi:Endonuclease/exonuclease/phosphatase superfamily [Arabidopsis thaliana x Arabidopsis arenosa]|uniref:Endonuclease/exonuclease/phosphatase superfamily n=1 Tax=Arabidopsis thaliana x Arabidopsis arenosa TaxID=1240361 RepID=A0A8T1Z2R2_9BRAS|nr:Endonuclease/exonuclease/phosphatase superfamily [Arabidopsis thaliana x Arabidopsis arenosa]
MAPGRSQLQRTERSWATLCCSASSSCLQLYWARFLLRKWFNISANESDHVADSDDEEDDDSVADSDIEGIEEAHDETNDAEPRLRRRNSETFRVQYMDTKAIRICVGTWNVGGRVPPTDLDIDGWVDTIEPADIYVLGLQEIVPLNAGNIFGIEDDRPALEWEDTIRDALNRIRPRKVKIVSYSDPPSPSKFKPFEDVTDVVEEMIVENTSDNCNVIHSVNENFSFNNGIVDTNYDKRSCLPRQEYLQRQFSSPKKLDRLFSMQLDTGSKRAESLSRWFSYSERVGLSWPEPPLRLLNQHVRERRCSLKSSLKPFKNYSSFKATANNLAGKKTPLLSDLDLKPLMNVRKPSYVKIVSKQMVGVFLTIWVRRSLRKHIRNLSVSTVGVGVMGYIGNKGAVSVSMSVYQTPFCFVCTHLASGEKDGDHRKRNADVSDIHRRTQFHPHSLSATRLPRSIRDHENIIWLGDLNYRINLSYEKAHELIARKDWKRLAEKDQLVREMRQGRVFEGWSEGTLDFPPTYKYEIDSEKYGGNDPKSGKRTPAWCDRIIWYGKGMKLMSYRRSEIKLSDHRPVTATFVVEVEVFSPRKLQRTLTLTTAEIDNHEAFVHD